MTFDPQGRLEEKVEALAEVVARPHLRKPRSEIIQITRLAREERESFLKQVAEGIKSVGFVGDTLVGVADCEWAWL